MAATKKVKDLAKALQADTPKPKKAKGATLEANHPHGQKSDYLRLSITLPPDIYALLQEEVTRRKIHKLPEPVISAIIREALAEKFNAPG